MGSCVSVHKNSPDAAMKLKLSFGSKNDKLVIPASPVKENTKPVNGEPPIKSQLSPSSRLAATYRDFDSKEETFFESQPWLESDCEDDFYSVNGDFTPSRGNTPVHQGISMGTPRVNKTLPEGRLPGSTPEPSPTEKKKKLVELFRESIREDENVDEQYSSGKPTEANGKMEDKQTVLDQPPKSAYGTPCVSGTNSLCGSERTANGDPLVEKEKPIRSVQCCLPSLSCGSFSERKKKMSSATAVYAKP